MLKYLLSLIILFISFDGLTAQTINPGFKHLLDSIYEEKVPQVSVEDFLKMNKNEVFVLDTRENDEFEVSHLKNARHVGYFWFDMRKIYDIPFTANIVVYCSIGSRSEKIGQKLVNSGYKNVYNLYGGIFEWLNSGQPVYKVNGVQTSEIHTYTKDLARWVEKGTKVN
ncbi:rhodanese-like domain-containing protein [Daejeonella lutea]|uniref:Rhodanese-related sulfurtransferase n=1 Tax=Daejeonella lutea TaxID=572036 RepID=A0A1T5A3D4_9SPHI|nr:rhodanese-like domain-containing protein [Daejeonella lutea]SKB29299.1 Rhodanese-related sulfurtransferase [Daejeonella lutea]